MAEKVEILNIETKQTEKSLKDLRAELKQLKTQLEEMVIGSDEYNTTLQEITQRQQQLSSVTKSSVSDMEGSYNALSKELSELRKAWKATNDEAERDSLGQQMSEINSKLKELDASVGNFQRNVGNYGSALDGLDDKLKDTGFSFDDAIESSNHWVAKGENIEKTSIAMVASFAMINQAMSLMGEESEGTRKVLEKLQIVMAMTAGFKQIAEGARGFLQLSKSINISKIALTGFKSAMIATGIGALVVVVGMLAANWDKVSKAIGLSSENARKFRENLFKSNEGDFDLNLRLAEAEGMTEDKLIAMRQKFYREQAEQAAKERERLSKSKKEEYDKAVEKEKEYLDALKQANNDYDVWLVKSRKEKQQQSREAYQKFQEDRKSALEEMKGLEEATGIDVINKNYNESIKKYQEYRAKRLITEEEYKQAELLIQKQYDKELSEYQLLQADEALARLESEQQGRLAMVDKLQREYQLQVTSMMDEYNSKMTDLSIAGKDGEMNKLTGEFIQSQIEALKSLKEAISVYGDEAVDAIRQIDSEISNLENQGKENNAMIDDEHLQKVLDLGDILISTADSIGNAWSRVFSSINRGIEEVGISINKGEKGWTKYGKIASAGIGVASDMLGTLADMQDTQTEEGFEKNKKLQIASATMAMLAGIVNTWQSVMSKENSWMTIWGQVAAGTSLSAMMLATGLAQINQIKSTTFEGGGGGSVATPNVTALSAIQNPVQTVNEVQGASTEGEIKDQRVYVLESDIASTNKKVNVAQSEATF